MCIAVDKDNSNNYVNKRLTIGKTNSSQITEFWKSKIEANSILYHDYNHSHNELIKKLKLTDIYSIGSAQEYSRNLQPINVVCSKNQRLFT